MIANLTTPLIGIVSTTAIGRLGDATLLAASRWRRSSSTACFWLFAFLRMSTVAFTAQSLGSGESHETRADPGARTDRCGAGGAGLIVLQIPLAAILLAAMAAATASAARQRPISTIRIWSAPLASPTTSCSAG